MRDISLYVSITAKRHHYFDSYRGRIIIVNEMEQKLCFDWSTNQPGRPTSIFRLKEKGKATVELIGAITVGDFGALTGDRQFLLTILMKFIPDEVNGLCHIEPKSFAEELRLPRSRVYTQRVRQVIQVSKREYGLFFKAVPQTEITPQQG